jgi:phosphopantetheine adenylyltransferase
VAKGGEMVNAKRKENGLDPVELVFVDMVKVEENETDAKFSNKMSSTLIRKKLLENS